MNSKGRRLVAQCFHGIHPSADHLPTGLLLCSAKTCAMFNAIGHRDASDVFDSTLTTIPRSGNVMNEVEPGLSDLFADGVTFAPGINIPAKYLGKTAKHSFGGAITTKEYTPFDAIRQAIIPGPPINPVQPQRGSWSVNYIFRQYIVERAARDGWGFFGQVSFADQATSPITTFFDVGLGGNGFIPSRRRDEFGLSYAYTDLSEELKNNLDLLPLGGSLQVEHQLEMFYNLHLTPWLQLTGDLQILRPNRPAADTAVVPAVRLRVVF